MDKFASLAGRVTHDSLQCGGRPCIRGMRIRVSDILEMLAENVSADEILGDFPDLEPEDIQACLLYLELIGRQGLILRFGGDGR